VVVEVSQPVDSVLVPVRPPPPQVPALPDDPEVSASQLFASGYAERFSLRAFVSRPKVCSLTPTRDARAPAPAAVKRDDPDDPDEQAPLEAVVAERHPREVRVVDDQFGAQFAVYVPLDGLALASTGTSPLRPGPGLTPGFSVVELEPGFLVQAKEVRDGFHLARHEGDVSFEGWIEADRLGWVFVPRPASPDGEPPNGMLQANAVISDGPSGKPIARVGDAAVEVRRGKEKGDFVEVVYQGERFSVRGWVQASRLEPVGDLGGWGMGGLGTGSGGSTQMLLAGTPLHLAAPGGTLGPQVGVIVHESHWPKLRSHGAHLRIERHFYPWGRLEFVAPDVDVARANAELAVRAARRARVKVVGVDSASDELLRALATDATKDAVVACADAPPIDAAAKPGAKAKPAAKPAKPSAREVEATVSVSGRKVSGVALPKKLAAAEGEFARCVAAAWTGRHVFSDAAATAKVRVRVEPR
jgi:hypothetical protein